MPIHASSQFDASRLAPRIRPGRRTVRRASLLLGAGLSLLDVRAAPRNPDLEVVTRVADYVIRNTDYTFINTATGQKLPSTEGLAAGPDIAIKDQYNFWQYPNAMISMALLRLHGVTGEEKYAQFPAKFYGFFFRNVGFMQRMMEAGHAKWQFSWFFRMTQLDDCGPHAAVLLDLCKTDPQPAYRDFIDRSTALMFDARYQARDGAWVKQIPVKDTLWIDDLYMGVSLLAKLGHERNERKYFDQAARQVQLYNRYMYDPATELYFHNYYTDLRRPGIAHWGRANGWCALAQADLLAYLPADHPQRPELLALFERQICGLSKYQSATGLWHQLLDKTDSYLETSCSVMFTYAVAKGMNEGWLDRRYAGLALEGWKGVASRVDPDGAVLGVCKQTGISDNLVAYYNRETPYNDFHATGTIIMAGLEIIKLKQTLAASRPGTK